MYDCHSKPTVNVSSRTNPGSEVSVSLPSSLLQSLPGTSPTILFTVYNSSALLPYSDPSDPRIDVGSTIVSIDVGQEMIDNLDENVTIVMRLEQPVSINEHNLENFLAR